MRAVPDALAGLLGEAGRHESLRAVRSWYATVHATLGPTASARTVFDRVAIPLVSHLGFRPLIVDGAGRGSPSAVLYAGTHRAAVLAVAAWGEEMTAAWRDGARRGIGLDLRWCLCVNGLAVRLSDTTRAYSRRFADFDLASTIEDEGTFAVFWGLLRADALAQRPDGTLLDRAVDLCERYRTAVRESLKTGVHEALIHLAGAFLAVRRDRSTESRIVDEALTVIYRVLFLLFAEARGLVPHWHPIYRDGYTLEALRRSVEVNDRPRGLWESLQAIARLAHRGCRAGTLRVPPFNGRLFSPVEAPLADTVRLDDAPVRRALLALTTRPGRQGRERIAYTELGVEQLGAVYEHVLDFTPQRATFRSIELRPSGRRKATGTFYTPRSLTEYLVRRTLAPLVETATPDAVLRLKLLDPSMGSGAFLVAACRYLGHAYEQALVREGGVSPADIDDHDRTGFRRAVAQRCLFGVDINPMAVQLARLSLWLATLSRDRPLTFLDHHLRTGDSLVGASVADILRQRPGHGRTAPKPLPLFSQEEFESGLRADVGPRAALAAQADDSLERVRNKERTLAWLNDPKGPLGRWRTAADVWCAAWFAPGLSGRTPHTLLRQVLDGNTGLPEHVAAPLLLQVRDAASRKGFFHWTLEFPEVFYGEDGAPLAAAGFDAILGNPPWEMLRADRGSAGPAGDLTRFARESGIYRLQGTGHPNLYQLFLERALSLLKPSGRLGFVVPWGLAADHGCARLRRALLGTTTVDTFAAIENRDAIFPVHRSLKFTLLTLSRGGRTAALPLRAGIRATDVLDRLPDIGEDPASVPVGEPLLTRLGGDGVAIPDFRSVEDLKITSQVVLSCPSLGGDDGWNVHFGRELNATEDRKHFAGRRRAPDDVPVVEGKHVQPFRTDIQAARFFVPEALAGRLLHGDRTFRRPRLAYRDVASPGNRLTLIAAVLPGGVVTTHTLFCLKEPLDLESQYFLCGIFNSYVANYLVRVRVSTHVSAAIIDRLPVPRPSTETREFRAMTTLARRLSSGDGDAGPEHQALAARLYGLDEPSFAHVLESFPLVSREVRDAALWNFRYIVR